MNKVKFTAIRGNASEIAALAMGMQNLHGVDTDENFTADAEELARTLAAMTGSVIILTGETDIVTDGRTSYHIFNGHPMMRMVTGAGCQLSALTGAILAANPDRPLKACLASVCVMGLCGEIAYHQLLPMEGNATYRNRIIDAMFNLKNDILEEYAKYEIYG